MADNKRYILDESQKDAYAKWVLDKEVFGLGYKDRPEYAEMQKIWLLRNPCPLPLPVEVPSDMLKSLQQQVEYIKNLNDPMNLCSWGHQHGVLISGNDANKLIEIFNKQ